MPGSVVLLGGFGFLGKLITRLFDGGTVIVVGRKDILVLDSVRRMKTSLTRLPQVYETYSPELILNLAACWRCDSNELESANREAGLNLARMVRAEKTKWIQIGSYFQEYFASFGVHYDRYSELKEIVWSDLQQIPFSSLVQVKLPHLVGPGASNLFSTITRAHMRSEVLRLSKGKEYLPVARGSEVAKAIVGLSRDLPEGVTDYYVEPEGQTTVRTWVEEFGRELGGLESVRWGDAPERPVQFLSPVVFSGKSIPLDQGFKISRLAEEYVAYYEK